MANLTPEQRKELLRKGLNLSRIEAQQPVEPKGEEPSLRNMTEEERKRLPYVRDASDPLAWGEEPGVQEDETTWDVLGGVGAGAAMAGRFAKGLSKKAADVAAAKAARSAAQGARIEDTISRLRQGKEDLRRQLRDEMGTTETLRGHLDTDAERLQNKQAKIEGLRNKYRDRRAYSQGLAEDLEEKRGLVRDLRRQNDTEVDTLRGRNEYIRELEDTVEDKRRRLAARGEHTSRRFAPPEAVTPAAETPAVNPETIRANMKRNIAEAGRKDLPEDFQTNWKESAKGRPWPEFVSPGGGVPLEHKGKKYRLTKWGEVFDERGRRMLTTGTDPENWRGVTSTNYTYYDGATPQRGSERSGLAQAARKRLAEIHGTLTSDSSGSTSQLAQQSWERTPGAIRRTAPRSQGGREGPQFILRHPEGGAIKKIVDELKKEEPSMADFYDKAVEAWLKKYGGNAVLGAAGLESLRNYLQDVSSESKK